MNSIRVSEIKNLEKKTVLYIFLYDISSGEIMFRLENDVICESAKKTIKDNNYKQQIREILFEQLEIEAEFVHLYEYKDITDTFYEYMSSPDISLSDAVIAGGIEDDVCRVISVGVGVDKNRYEQFTKGDYRWCHYDAIKESFKEDELPTNQYLISAWRELKAYLRKLGNESRTPWF